MTGCNHTLAGSIIAVIAPAPLVPVVALASHFLLDAMPHFGRDPRITPFNRPFRTLLLIDALLCVSVLIGAWWLFPDKWLIITIGVGMACLPDFLWLLDGRIGWLAPFFRFAARIQWGERPWGWWLEIGYGIVMLTVLWWLAQS